MRFSSLHVVAAMPASSLREWLDRELEMRGIDAVVYTHYILSILQQDTSRGIEPLEKDFFPLAANKRRDNLLGKSKNKNKLKSRIQDSDEIKKTAAVECLMSVSEQKCGIEELVEELCIRLKSIECDSFANRDSFKSFPDNDFAQLAGDLTASPEEQAEKYYAAFPSLNGTNTVVELETTHKRKPAGITSSVCAKKQNFLKKSFKYESFKSGSEEEEQQKVHQEPAFIVPKCKYRVLKERLPSYRHRLPFNRYESGKSISNDNLVADEVDSSFEDGDCEEFSFPEDADPEIDKANFGCTEEEEDTLLKLEEKFNDNLAAIWIKLDSETVNPVIPDNIIEDSQANWLFAECLAWRSNNDADENMLTPAFNSVDDALFDTCKDCEADTEREEWKLVWEVLGAIGNSRVNGTGEKSNQSSVDTTGETRANVWQQLDCIDLWQVGGRENIINLEKDKRDHQDVSPFVDDGFTIAESLAAPKNEEVLKMTRSYDSYLDKRDRQDYEVSGSTVYRSENSLLAPNCTLTHHKGESLFVEVKPRNIVRHVPRSGLFLSSHYFNEHDVIKFDDTENLLTSPTTHFCPIRQLSSDFDEVPIVEAVHVNEKPDPNECVNKEVVLLTEEMEAINPENQYMSYRGQRDRCIEDEADPSVSSCFVPKFRLRSNLEKYCQTEDNFENEDRLSSSSVERGSFYGIEALDFDEFGSLEILPSINQSISVSEALFAPKMKCFDNATLWTDDELMVGDVVRDSDELKSMREEIKNEEAELFDDIDHMRSLDDWNIDGDNDLDERDALNYHNSLAWPQPLSSSDIYQEAVVECQEDEDYCSELDMINCGGRHDVNETFDFAVWDQDTDEVILGEDTNLESDRQTGFLLFEVLDGCENSLVPKVMPSIPASKVIYSSDLEDEWIRHVEPFGVQMPKRNLVKLPKRTSDSQRKPCSFFMDGSCRRNDCKFSHDLGTITCRFWEESSCFKGITCPFLHGYPKSPRRIVVNATSKLNKNYKIESEYDFPALSKSVDSTSNGGWIQSALTVKRKKKRSRIRHHSMSIASKTVESDGP